MNEQAKGNAPWTALAALLMLYYGWAVGTIGISDSDFYNTVVDVFNWMLRVGGVCLLLVAMICFAGLRIGLLLDALVSGICGLVIIFCAVVYIKFDGLDLYYLLYVLFGGLFVNAARNAGASFLRTAPGATGQGSTGKQGWFGAKSSDAPTTAQPAEPPHPASIRPDSLPKDGEPPPPDGYLAALSKEDEEPPTASFE